MGWEWAKPIINLQGGELEDFLAQKEHADTLFTRDGHQNRCWILLLLSYYTFNSRVTGVFCVPNGLPLVGQQRASRGDQDDHYQDQVRFAGLHEWQT